MKKTYQMRSRKPLKTPIFLFISATFLLLLDFVFSKNVESSIISKDLKKLIVDYSPDLPKNASLSESDIESIFINFTENNNKKSIKRLKHEEVIRERQEKTKTEKHILKDDQETNNINYAKENENFQAEFLKELLLDEDLKNIIETSSPENLEECLESEAIDKIAKKTNQKLSKNKKFILGKCNPILLVAGFLGTRLRAVIDCESLAADPSALSELRFFCGKTLCQNSFFSGYKKEEHTLWPSLFNSPFKLFHDKSNPDNSCMAYFMRFFNDENECPYLENISEPEKETIEKQNNKEQHDESIATEEMQREIDLENQKKQAQQILMALEGKMSEPQSNKENPYAAKEEIDNLIEKNKDSISVADETPYGLNNTANRNELNNKANKNKTINTEDLNVKSERINSNSDNKDGIKKPICFYSKHIKVTYYGNTEQTYDKLNCGLNAMCNILDLGYPIIPGKLINTPATAGYFKLSEFLKAKGYEEGFSLAGMPYDFRNFSKKDSKFQKQFYDLVQMLHKNTGKKVIVVAHSLGNLLINDILSLPENKEKSQKLIERNIALAPPYIGTMKDMELFISGTLEFRADLPAGNVVDVSLAAQKFFGSFNPNFYLLLLKPFMHNLLKKPEYREFVEAISERLKLERKCKSLIGFGEEKKNNTKNFNNQSNKDECSEEYIEINSKKFSALFPFIPKLNSPECKKLYKIAEGFVNETDFVNEKFRKRKDIYENLPTYEGCFLRIYDYLNCPSIKVKEENDTSIDVNEFEQFCLDDEQKIKSADADDMYFTNSCEGGHRMNNCQENFIKKYIKYDSSDLFKSKSADKNEKIPEKYNLNNSEFQETVRLMQKYQDEISPNKDILQPNVPLSIVYGSFLDTKAAFLYNRNQGDGIFNWDQVNFYGGDGTVNSYSSVLPGLKWIYDAKLNKEQNKVEILNYCSFLSKDSDYAYFENLKNNSTMNKTYYALECECLEEKGYNLKFVGKDKDKCSHASLLSDKYVINFVYVSSSKLNVYDDYDQYPSSIKNAFSSYNDKFSFVSECDSFLTSK